MIVIIFFCVQRKLDNIFLTIYDMNRARFTDQDAIEAASEIGFSLSDAGIEPRSLAAGMAEEMEHGGPGVDPRLNITNGDPIMSARIALAHLFERADYYDLLESVMDPRKHILLVNIYSVIAFSFIILFILLLIYLLIKYGGADNSSIKISVRPGGEITATSQ